VNFNESGFDLIGLVASRLSIAHIFSPSEIVPYGPMHYFSEADAWLKSLS
jgi:hypothetical protein